MAWLEGKRALVVGAGSGMAAPCLTCSVPKARRSPRWSWMRPRPNGWRPNCPAAWSARATPTALADSRAAVRAVTDAFGGLDVLVNCVGIFDFDRGLAGTSPTISSMPRSTRKFSPLNVKSQLPPCVPRCLNFAAADRSC